jgi:hypothetical protein
MLKPGQMLGLFGKTPAVSAEPVYSVYSLEAANPFAWDLSSWFPAIPAFDYFIRLHRVENQSQS